MLRKILKSKSIIILQWVTVVVFTFLLNFISFAQLPDDFIDDLLYSNLDEPVGIQFDKNGRGYLWERKGKVLLIDTNDQLILTPLIDISDEVGGWRDHGLLSFALDPQFLSNGYIYLFYTVDRHHLINNGSPDYDPNFDEYADASISRITRYRADPNNDFKSVLPDSRKILLGTEPSDGFPVLMPGHGVGSLIFGSDGSLLASYGDQGSFSGIDVGNYHDTYHEKAMAEGIIREAENVGAYKSQILNSLAGKILRLDPETGDGLSSNPYFESDDPRSPKSRVWVRGLRNPFKITLRPNTGSHNSNDGDPGVIYISDVGGGRWEELNIAKTSGLNFGWPIYEGFEYYNHFADRLRPNKDAPNHLVGLSDCENEYYTFHDLLFQKNNQFQTTYTHPCDEDSVIESNVFPSVHTQPVIAWRNASKPDTISKVDGFDEEGWATGFEIDSEKSSVVGHHFNGNSAIMGGFYTAEQFPEKYHGTLFSADFSGWIKIFNFDENDKLLSVDSFHNSTKNITDITVNPVNGAIYYIRFNQNQLRRISFGGNARPIAKAEADIYYGPSPLIVNFTSWESYDPEGGELDYFWEFGDGKTSSEINPTHEFMSLDNNPVGFEVTLTVTDTEGASASTSKIISLNNTPPQVEILGIDQAANYPNDASSLIELKAQVTDQEHDATQLSYAWQTTLHHNDHSHPNAIDPSVSSTVLLEPTGCDEIYWYRIDLSVTDAAGLTSTDYREIYPWCGDKFLEELNLTGEGFMDGIHLEWEVKGEEELDKFEIQRLEDLKTIGAVNYSNSSIHKFIDESPLIGLNTYRIKAIADDGRYLHSNQFKLHFPPDPEIRIFPNPANRFLKVKFKEFGKPTNVQLLLYNAIGGLVREEQFQIEPGPNEAFFMRTEGLNRGLYFYKAFIGESGIERAGNIFILNEDQ